MSILKKAKKAKLDQIVEEMKGLTLAGEIVTWNPKAGKDHTYVEVVEALKACGLDDQVAREFLPRHAFARACRTMSADRIIDIFKEEGSELVFQFTDKILKEHGWEYDKKTFVRLNRETGVITCPVQQLQELAQKELDRAMVTRTTSDITRIVQRLFEIHADLFAVRDQGGAYFVPILHQPFVEKIDLLMTKLGGHLRRIPVPAGTQRGDKEVQDLMAETLAQLIQDHNAAVALFSVNTQKGTIESAADKIKATRVKVEAYANYLQERSKDLLKEVDAANQKLREQVAAIAGQKASAPPVDKDARLVFGHPMTAVVRWMAKQNWTFEQIKTVLVEELKVPISDGTIKTQSGWARRGSHPPADLAEAQVKKLNALRKKIAKKKVQS